MLHVGLGVLASIVIFIAGSLLFLVVDPKLLLLVRFIQGLGAAAPLTASITLVAKYFGTGRDPVQVKFKLALLPVT